MSPRRSFLILLPALAAVVGVAVISVVVVTGGGFFSSYGAAGSDSGPAPALEATASSSWVVALDDQAPGGLITIIDPKLASVVGQVTAGYSPWVVLRPSKSQLLLSRLFGPGDVEGPSLQVFDLSGDLGSPTITVPMPNRTGDKVYNSGMTLSKNERFLFYEGINTRCPEGGNSLECDYSVLGIIDLDSGVRVATATMDDRCASLTPHGEESVLAACGYPTITLREVAADGSIAELGGFPRREVGPVAIGASRDGTYSVVYADGVVLTADDSVPIADLFVSGDHAGFNTRVRLSADQVLLAYSADGSAPFQGLVLFDGANPSDVRRFTLPFETRHVGYVDETHVAVLSVDGSRVAVIDLETGASVGDDIVIPGGAWWLVGQ